MKHIWLDGIMGVVVGDALGVPVEFCSREELKLGPVEDMEEYGPTICRLGAGLMTVV